MARNKVVNRTTAETKAEIVENSVQNISSKPVLTATELKKQFVKPVVNEDGAACAISELDRVADETNAALDEVYAYYEDKTAETAEYTERAKSYADKAAQSEETAKTYAQSASQSEVNAASDSSRAERAAEVAAESATIAQDNADKAEKYAMSATPFVDENGNTAVSAYYSSVVASNAMKESQTNAQGAAASMSAAADSAQSAETAAERAEYAAEQVQGIYRYRGTVATYADLEALTEEWRNSDDPSSVLNNGDVYNVEEAYGDFGAGTNFAWNESEEVWDSLGGSFSVEISAIGKSGQLSQAIQSSLYQTVTAAQKTEWSNKQNALTFDAAPTAVSANPVTSGGVYNALADKADKTVLNEATTAISALSEELTEVNKSVAEKANQSDLTATKETLTEAVAATNVKVEALERSVDTLEEEVLIEYGCRWVTNASAPEVERVVRKNGVITHWDIEFTPNYGEVHDNPFDRIAPFNPQKITDDFGNVFSRFPRFYHAQEVIGNYTYWWVCKKQRGEKYHLPRAFWRMVDGVYAPYWDYVDIGVYEAGQEVEDGITYLVSKTDKIVAHNFNRTAAFNQAKAWNDKVGSTKDEYYQITTLSEITEILQPLLVIMYGTKNAQNMYYGYGSINSAAYEVDAYDSATNTFYWSSVKNAAYNNIGFSFAFNNSTNGADYRRIVSAGTAVGTVTDGVFTADASGTTYYTYTHDGEPYAGTVSTVAARPIQTGTTDSIDASHGATAKSWYTGFKTFNIENIWLNVYKHILDTTIKDYRPYVCRDIENWAETSTPETSDIFVAADYTVAETSSAWAKALGYGEDNPDIVLPTEIGASSATYWCDYYYVNSGVRTTLFGGSLGYGSNGGPFYWHLHHGLGTSDWSIGARLSHRALKRG